MDACIILIGCFDTKGEAFSYLRTRILAQGERVLTINTGVMGTTTAFPVDFESDEVARHADQSIDELRREADRGRAIDVMGKGAAAIVKQLADAGQIKAIIGMGGGGGTFITLSAMQAVPFGIPKLCLTTFAAKDLSRHMGSKDITLMASVVDIAGLNSILTLLLDQAAAAICAMANVKPAQTRTSSGRIAVSMFGNTTACVDQCTELLRQQGYEVFAFHANGVGGKTMESLILDSCFDAVLDITTTELADDLCGGVCSAGPDRLLAAGKMGIPQVVVPGCLDMVNFAHSDTVPAHFSNRRLYSWAPDVTLMRTNETENEQLGQQLAQKLNQSSGPVTIVLPLKGVSQVDSEGNVFYQPQANSVLFESIKNSVADSVTVIESAAHINDKSFSALLVQCLLTMLQPGESTQTEPIGILNN